MQNFNEVSKHIENKSKAIRDKEIRMLIRQKVKLGIILSDTNSEEMKALISEKIKQCDKGIKEAENRYI